MIKKTLLVLVILILMFLGWVAAQPGDYAISREITVHAPADKIFPYLNNSKLAAQWGPWLEVDPAAKMSYSGPDSGVGSRTSWVSTGHLGTGSATIVESVANERVGIRLEYTKPMAMAQDSEYLIHPNANDSLVIWRVKGTNSFMGRLLCVFMDMDKMVGQMFEKGLSNLKTLTEKP